MIESGVGLSETEKAMLAMLIEKMVSKDFRGPVFHAGVKKFISTPIQAHGTQ